MYGHDLHQGSLHKIIWDSGIIKGTMTDTEISIYAHSFIREYIFLIDLNGEHLNSKTQSLVLESSVSCAGRVVHVRRERHFSM